MCLAINVEMASSESRGMALVGISTAFSSTAATRGAMRAPHLRHPRRWSKPVGVVSGAAFLTDESESIGNVLLDLTRPCPSGVRVRMRADAQGKDKPQTAEGSGMR
jgi:hypothetical protein